MEYQNYVTETAENAGFQESCSDAKLRKLIASLGFFVGAQEEWFFLYLVSYDQVSWFI